MMDCSCGTELKGKHSACARERAYFKVEMYMAMLFARELEAAQTNSMYIHVWYVYMYGMYVHCGDW